MSLTVELLHSGEEEAWDQYVNAHPQGTPFHLIAWKETIESTFSYTAQHLLVRDRGEIAGLLPLFLVENRLQGRVLLSSPFAVYGGALVSTGAARDALRDYLVALGRRLRVQHIELRNRHPEQALGFAPVDRYVTFSLETVEQPDDEFLRSLPKKTRNLVRKSLRYDYSSRLADGLDGFYDLLAETYRRLGTPIFPKRFFEALTRNFGSAVDVREVMLGGEVVAVNLNFFFGGEMHTYFAASSRAHFSKSPNNFMYFDLIQWAASHSFRVFDFGRSKKETGNFEFKKHWGAVPHELPYEILLVERKETPNFTPKNPKFELAIRLWRRLPLPVTRAVGPHLIKLFP